MGRRKGFNTPFTDLELPPEPPAESSEITDDGPSQDDIAFDLAMHGVSRRDTSGDATGGSTKERVEPRKQLEALTPDDEEKTAIGRIWLHYDGDRQPSVDPRRDAMVTHG